MSNIPRDPTGETPLSYVQSTKRSLHYPKLASSGGIQVYKYVLHWAPKSAKIGYIGLSGFLSWYVDV